MGRVVRFSKFDNYLSELRKHDIKTEGTILDANVIITLSYSPKKFHTRTYEFIKNKIIHNDISLHTTVNTTQEYLEFYRRLLITEGLRTAIHPNSNIVIPEQQKNIIKLQSNILQKREQKDEIDPVFYDREIKKIRQSFCSLGKSGLEFWKAICDEYVRPRIKIEYNAIEKLNINYLSIYDEEMKRFFRQKITWDNAMEICSDMAIGFSDSMILNALESTTFPFAITLDTDMAFAVLGNSSLKDIVMPDGIIEKNEALSKLL